MPIIIVDIESLSKAQKFLYLIKNIKFVKNAWIEPENSGPLNDEEWIKPGRPVTEEELEACALEYDLDTERYTTEGVRDFVKEGLTKYRAGK